MRIYMAGPVDGMPDLGRRWRVEVTKAIVARGHTPLWPSPDLHAVDDGRMTPDEARKRWTEEIERARTLRHDHDPRLICLHRIAYDSDVVLAFKTGDDYSAGTATEVQFAAWLGIPKRTFTCPQYWRDINVDYLRGAAEEAITHLERAHAARNNRRGDGT